MRRAASARRREENKAALVSDLERTRAEADARQQARRDAISASFAESAMRADQRRQAMAPVPPERPTLREQAAAARAKRGLSSEDRQAAASIARSARARKVKTVAAAQHVSKSYGFMQKVGWAGDGRANAAGKQLGEHLAQRHLSNVIERLRGRRRKSV